MLHKKKLKKIIVFLVAVIIAFSCLIFTASALSEPLFYLTVAQPTVSPQNAYVEVYYNSGWGDNVEVVMFSSSSSEGIYLDIYEGYIVARNRDESNDTALAAFWLSTSGNGGFLNSFEGSITEDGYGTIKGLKAYGFANVTPHYSATLSVDFNVVYGNEQVSYQQ